MPRTPLSKKTKRFKQVVRFLLGEGKLNGRWFGDDPPKTKTGRPMPYWWRSHLRGATEEVLFELWSANERAAPFAGVRPGDFKIANRKE